MGFSPDGKWLLGGDNNGQVIVWATDSGEALLVLKEERYSPVHAAAFSPDGLRIAIGNQAGQLSWWDARDGRLLLTIKGHTNAIESLAYFPDGKRLVSASYDSTARVWDNKDGRELLAFHGHTNAVTCVAVSPDGHRVATGGADRSVRVWDAGTAREQLVLGGFRGSIDGIAFSADGRRLAATSLDGTIKVWEVAPQTEPVGDSGSGTELRLQSDYIPRGVRLPDDPGNREIRSVRLTGRVPVAGDGEGQVWLDTRSATLSPFGDVLQRAGPEPAPIQAKFRFVSNVVEDAVVQMSRRQLSNPSEGFRLYEVRLLGNPLQTNMSLVLGTTNLGPHRLLVGRGRMLRQIIPLYGDPPIRSAYPDAALSPPLWLEGRYTAADSQIRRLEIRGTPGGAGTLLFDLNRTTFDAYGEPGMSTAAWYRPHDITLELADAQDPLGHGRRLYRAAPKDPSNTNRIDVVLGQTELGSHRVLLYQGNQLAFLVPMVLPERGRQEIAASEYARLSEVEQRAVASLREAMGNDFRCEISSNRVTGIHLIASAAGRFPGMGVLAGLPHLRSVHFGGGQFPVPCLADLPRLEELKVLTFNSSEMRTDAMTMLGGIKQLEALTFRECRGLDDEGVAQLAPLKQLKTLSFYTEQLLRGGELQQHITDAGVAHLKDMVWLENLDLFGNDVGDASVAVFSRMTELRDLGLSGRRFTDSGLEGLAGLTNLRSLRLYETGVTTNGVAALKARVPQLEVQAWWRDHQE